VPGPGLVPGVYRARVARQVRGVPLRYSVVCVARLLLVVLASCGDQPWRCLWRRFSQITMTRPCRRM